MKTRTRFISLLLFLSFGITTKMAAQFPLSGDVQVNTITATMNYADIDIATAPDGRYSITWNQNASSTLTKTYKRGYTNTGVPNFSAQDVVYNTPPASYDGDTYPRISMGNSGDYIVTYQENNSNIVTATNFHSIFYQRYFANGVPNGARVFVDYGMWPDIDIAPDGTFNIAYVSGHYAYCPQAVYVKRYLPSGTVLGARITIATQACTGVGYYDSNVRSRNGGAFDITYNVGNSNSAVSFARYNTSGVNVYTNFGINGATTGQNFVLKPSGDIVFASLPNNGSSPNVFQSMVSRVTAAGSSVSSYEYLSTYTTTAYSAYAPSIGINDAGDYVVVFPKYISNVYQGIYIQQYSVNDIKVGPEYPVSTVNNTMLQASVDVSDCSFVVSWKIGNDVFHKGFGLYPNTNGSIVTSSTICAGSLITVTGSYSGIAPSSYSWQLAECDASGVLVSGGYSYTSPTYSGTPGTYTFPGSSSLACAKYYSVKLIFPNACAPIETTSIIYIRCNPTPTISSSANPICYGGSTTLCSNYSPSPAISVYWNTGATSSCISVSPTVTTVYSTQVTAKGCSAMATYTVNVTSNNPSFALTTNLPSTSSPYCTAIATPTINPATAGISYYWEVSEIDLSTGAVIPNTTVTNPNCWWLPASSNNFYGYDYTVPYTSANNTGTAFNGPAGACTSTALGKFAVDHKYRVTYGTWTSTCPWQQMTAIIYACPGCRFANGSDVLVEISEVSSENTTEMGRMQGIKNSTDLHIYPNPSNGSFTIASLNDDAKDIYVYDLMGKMVYLKKGAKEQNINIDISNLPKGIFIVKIISNNIVQTQRIITQ